VQILLGLLFLVTFNLWGATEVQIPALSSPVVDQANFLNETEKADLSQLAYEIYTHQGPQITILTIPDLQGFPIEDFSIRVAEKWQLGSKEKDNGLLIVISKAERQMRIEVGNGIEGEVTDFDSNQYIQNILVPSFKEGKFHTGLRLVMQDIAAKFNIDLSGEKIPMVSRSKTPIRTEIPFPVILIIIALFVGHLILYKKPLLRGLFTGTGLAGVGFLMTSGFAIGMIIILFIIGLLIGVIGLHNILYALNSGGRGYGGGGGYGGSGGGSWGGGGGGFSGGGSSGSW
jgi:uncharacterized protein